MKREKPITIGSALVSETQLGLLRRVRACRRRRARTLRPRARTTPAAATASHRWARSRGRCEKIQRLKMAAQKASKANNPVRSAAGPIAARIGGARIRLEIAGLCCRRADRDRARRRTRARARLARPRRLPAAERAARAALAARGRVRRRRRRGALPAGRRGPALGPRSRACRSGATAGSTRCPPRTRRLMRLPLRAGRARDARSSRRPGRDGWRRFSALDPERAASCSRAGARAASSRAASSSRACARS